MPGTEAVALDAFNEGKRNNYHAFSLSGSVNALGGEIMLQSQFALGKNKGDAVEGEKKFNTWSVGTAYFYHFSKRTLMYAQAGVGGTGKAMKAANDLRGWNATIGLNHTF